MKRGIIFIKRGAVMCKTFSEEERLSLFKKNENVTKEDVLSRIKQKQNRYKEKIKQNGPHPVEYYSLLYVILEAFYKKVYDAVLFETLPDYWAYYLDYSYDEFSLSLCHVFSYEIDNDGDILWTKVDAAYKLISIRPKSFSPEEYSQFYNVEQGTIRQWIRRGKIRTAYKEGKGWKIPELTPPPAKGYESAQYSWTDKIQDIPKEYEFLNVYVLATFYQDQTKKNIYHVLFVSKETFENNNTDKNKELLLTAQEREKLELFMISHPQIKYCGKII